MQKETEIRKDPNVIKNDKDELVVKKYLRKEKNDMNVDESIDELSNQKVTNQRSLIKSINDLNGKIVRNHYVIQRYWSVWQFFKI